MTLFLASSHSECLLMLESFKQMAQSLGVPIADHKTCSPSTTLEFLGIELETIGMTARLTVEKLAAYEANIRSILSAGECTLGDLRSITGKLQLATTVIPGGSCFLRRLYNTRIGMHNHSHKGNFKDI